MSYEILEVRDDNTYVIIKDGMPYHVTPEYCPDLYNVISAQIVSSTSEQ